ncbi:SusC/RagA family TonB-linked outer membrane protein [Capnocytophaga felis]|uniref:SusC/RagA family TonB-linked outer membrane protein n=1 Tax=Capnocytophaga felis TaxID=2267611 RepID=A0A5M4B7A0_9FLAO|nr:TonB-dependent receptor [Capnocytophaga felis]GET45479.1 SusC/RagA family TonB-linked outer membrane protein [Capnocytophaga felis]GET47358.1 SusC/RagA family TonB-linked outer membrane protein [Capnocytophaga felis]
MKVLKKYVVSFVLLLGWIASVEAQSVLQVTGTVNDDTGMPLSGVSVMVKGTTKGTSTDFNGKFELKDVPQGAILEFSFIGFKTIDVRVTGNTVNVKMQEETEELDEIVVIGYGTQKKGDVTTAITSVSTKDIDQRPVTSAAQAIQGRAAGVQVVQPNGSPGAGLIVRIRGNTSISASNDPLYVVDGVPVQDISGIAPTDIQDMQILKDASSSAIYGSRAANGVVLITTKKGVGDQPKVSFNSYVGLSQVGKRIESLNTAQYKELMDEIGIIVLPDGLTDQTDWFDETFRKSITQSKQLALSNASEKTKYYISLGHSKEEGVIRTSFFERYNVRLNLENKVRDWLSFEANVSYGDYSSNGIITGLGSNRAGVVLSVINAPKYAPIWSNKSGEEGWYYYNFYGANLTHPIENISRNSDNTWKNNRFTGSGSAIIQLLPGLKFKSTFAIDRLVRKDTRWTDPIATSYGRSIFGLASDTRTNNTVLTFDNLLTFDKNINKHSLSFLAGTSGTTSDWNESYLYVSHFFSSDIKTLNAGNKVLQGSGTKAAQWAIMSYLGRFSYNYDGKYLLTANFRADGSSKLAPSKRWGYFPSVSVGWRISREEFLKDVAWLSDLKLRGGWGQVGNQAGISDYGYLQRYSIGRQNWWEPGKGNAMITLTPNSFSNPNLTWETTTQSNIGLDLSLFKSRLSLTVDAYYKKTTDLLMDVPLPATSPIPNIYRNEGEMVNKGIEFALSSQNLVNNFTWNTAFNISFNRNELTKLSLQKTYYYGNTSESTSEQVVRITEGEPLGKFWGLISEGVDPNTGDIKFTDLNGDGKISVTDKTYIGDPNPDFTFGMTNDFSYKNFALSIFLQGSYGNDIYNASRIETEGMYKDQNQSTVVLNRWRKKGQITDIPRAVNSLQNVRASSRWVEDGSYLRLKTITLSYNLSNETLKKYGINKIQPYITGQNLWTLTNYKGFDPEVNEGLSGPVQGIDWGTYPQIKTLIFGLNIDF